MFIYSDIFSTDFLTKNGMKSFLRNLNMIVQLYLISSSFNLYFVVF